MSDEKETDTDGVAIYHIGDQSYGMFKHCGCLCVMIVGCGYKRLTNPSSCMVRIQRLSAIEHFIRKSDISVIEVEKSEIRPRDNILLE